MKLTLKHLAFATLASSVAAIVLLPVAALASVVTLDFDDYPDSNTVITDQFAAQGVTFQNTVEDDSLFQNPGYPTESGTGEITDGNFVDNMIATFTTPSVTVSGYYTDPYGIELEAFDSTGTLLGTENLPDVYSAIDPFSITEAAGISSLEFQDLAPNDLTAYEGVDNFSFDVPNVPEPSSLLLLFAGVGLLGVVIRRRRAVQA